MGSIAGVKIAEAERRYDERMDAAWRRLEAKVAAAWDRVAMPTVEEYVTYSDDVSRRAIINYESNTMTVEAIVETSDPAVVKTLQQRLAKQLQDTLVQKDGGGNPFLKGQVRTSSGQDVTPQNSAAFAQAVVSRAVVTEKPFVAQDGQERRKAVVRVPLASDSMEQRAEIYMLFVEKYAKTFKIHPAVVLAMIHTESRFNPYAKSYCAYGLMQLVPKYGAYEATSVLSEPEKGKPKGKKRIPSSTELYDPEYNICLGTAYLYITQRDFFPAVPGNKLAFLLVASYNCGGPKCRAFMKSKGEGYLGRASDDMFFDDLRGFVPSETKAYLPNVRKRVFQWKDWYARRPRG
jgi:membrane-bound lytic murein transglycosylase C